MSSSPYAPAAKLLNQIWEQRKGLKTVAYNRQGELTCSKSTYAQCAHVLQHKPLLDRLLSTISMEVDAKNKGLLYVLLYELLLGPNQAIRGGGALKRQLMKHETEFQQALEQIREEEGYSTAIGGKAEGAQEHDGDDETKVTIPRYVRVNTLKTTTAKVIQALKAKGLMKKTTNSIFMDPHVPNVLVLPPTPETRAQLQDLVTSHEVVLQDKSSCFSALCLVHGFSDQAGEESNTHKEMAYLDACAAPGNKTSHLAALVVAQQQQRRQQQQQSSKNGGGGSSPEPTIHALDKSPDRYKLLQRRMKDLVGSAMPTLKCHNLDFFEVSSSSAAAASNNSNIHQYFPNVRAILLDPSCSGSGMTNNHLEAAQQHGGDPSFCNDRVQSLAGFQLQALKHATSSETFPHATRVVYSTCSLYLEENEKVVQRFLDSQQEIQEDHDYVWSLVAPKCLTTWKRRGLPVDGLTQEQTDAMIRVHPDHDASNGFFVACLEKRPKQINPPKQKQQQNKNKKGKPSSDQNEGPRIDTSSLPLYNNEFHDAALPSTKSNKKRPEGDGQSTKTTSTASPAKRKIQMAEDPSKKKNSKRSKPSLDVVSSEDGARKQVDESSSNNDDKHSKKRAKKLEWKRKQRERKTARLEAKEKPENKPKEMA